MKFKSKLSVFGLGKLYKCPEYSLMIYPSKEKAIMAWYHVTDPAYMHQPPAFWSITLSCKVHCSRPEEIFMLLEQNYQFLHVLFGDRQGWIVFRDWMNIVEAQNEVKVGFKHA